MADAYSFDIVAEIPIQNLRNALDAAKKELATRYDFKGSKSSLELKEEQKAKPEIIAIGDDDFKLSQLLDLFRSKLVRQEVDLKGLDWTGKKEAASQGTIRQSLTVRQGLSQEIAKVITAALRDSGLKVKGQIQGDVVRVSSASKDALQSAMGVVKALDVDAPLSFTNYR